MDNQIQTNQNLTIPEEVTRYLEGLLVDAGMTLEDEDLRQEMIKELFFRLDSFITSVIVKSLPEEYLDEFIKMNEEKKSQKEMEEYLQDKIPNARDLFAKAFINFREYYLGGTSKAKPVENSY